MREIKSTYNLLAKKNCPKKFPATIPQKMHQCLIKFTKSCKSSSK